MNGKEAAARRVSKAALRYGICFGTGSNSFVSLGVSHVDVGFGLTSCANLKRAANSRRVIKLSQFIKEHPSKNFELGPLALWFRPSSRLFQSKSLVKMNLPDE